MCSPDLDGHRAPKMDHLHQDFGHGICFTICLFIGRDMFHDIFVH